MTQAIGVIQALYRYPIKSMAGEPLDTADLGWHGLEGDRRFAFRRVQDQSGFPWLTASRLPELILYKPAPRQLSAQDSAPTHVHTPDGSLLALDSEALCQEIVRRFGAQVQLTRLKHGIFDEAPLSLITEATIEKIADEAGVSADVRRFRPNVFIHTYSGEAFSEDQWVGKAIVFGSQENSPAVNIALRDERCVMVNLDSETAQANSAVLKSIVRLNQNCAGVYSTVIRPGLLKVNEEVFLRSLP
ncbi:MAG: MOSC N-terminal beta barrel domain-containing protein [Chloroflexota bacterium]